MSENWAGVAEPAEIDDDDANLRVPHFPVYSELRHCMPVCERWRSLQRSPVRAR